MSDIYSISRLAPGIIINLFIQGLEMDLVLSRFTTAPYSGTCGEPRRRHSYSIRNDTWIVGAMHSPVSLLFFPYDQ